MEITELQREEENAWDAYVYNSNNSTFYHQIGWRNVVAMTYEDIQTVDDGMIEKMLIEEAKRIWKDYNEGDNNLYLKKVDIIFMRRTIVAVYERGIFKPLQKIDLPEHKRVHLVVIPEEDTDTKLLESQKKELSSIIGIGESGISDISRRHDQYIYEE